MGFRIAGALALILLLGNVIVNAQPTPFDAIADAVISTPIGEALPLIFNAA